MPDSDTETSFEGTLIKEVSNTSTVKELDKTSALVIRAIHVALSPLEKWVLQKEYNLAETKKLLEQKLKDTPVDSIITPPPYIAVPALQSISYCMDDEQLRDMYAELLAHSMNTATVDNVHPTFVEIIRQLSPFDATVFKELTKTLVQPCISIKYMNVKTLAAYPVQDIVAFPDVDKFPLVPTQISLENLERLRLIEINKRSKYNNQAKYEVLKDAVRPTIQHFLQDNSQYFNANEYQVAFDEFVLLIRGFGQFFARACLGTDFHDIG